MSDKKENVELELLGNEYNFKGGVVIDKETGEISRSKMFDIFNLSLDDYTKEEENWSQQDMRRIRMQMMKMKTGVQSMAPVLCSGPVRCPFRHRCPVVDRSIMDKEGNIDFSKQDPNKYPLGRQCPFEREYLDFKRTQYSEEFDVDFASPTEMGMINRLALLDLYEYRLILVLAHGDDKGEGLDLMKSQVTGTTPMGSPVIRKEAHPAWEQMEKIHKQREDILKSMVGTRREKYKQAAALKHGGEDNLSSSMAALKQKLEKLQSGEEFGEIIEAEFSEKV